MAGSCDSLLSARHNERSSWPFFSSTLLNLHTHASPTFSHIMFTHCKSGLFRKSSAFIAGDRFASRSERTTWYSRFAISPSIATPVVASTHFSLLKHTYMPCQAFKKYIALPRGVSAGTGRASKLEGALPMTRHFKTKLAVEK